MSRLHNNCVLPKGYKLIACFNAGNELCGCKQAVRKLKRQRDGHHAWPQCRAHGCNKEAGCKRLVEGMAALGVQGAIHQWPIQAELYCDRQGASRDKRRRSSGGGRFQKGRRSHVDIVYVRGKRVVLGVEVAGEEHADARVRRADARKDKTAARSQMVLHRLDLSALESKEDWQMELQALADVVGCAP